MPVVIPDGYAEATYSLVGPGPEADAFVTCGWAFVGAGTPVQANMDALVDAFITRWKNVVGSAWKFTGGVVRIQDQGVLRVYQVARSVVGVPTGAVVPPQVAVLMRKVSGIAGRRNQGRCYIPGITTSAVAQDGTILSASLVSWQAAAEGWRTDTEALEPWGAPVILHDVPAGSPAPAPTPVGSFQVQSLLATQRRRLR